MKSGRGTQTARATGSFGIERSGGTASSSLATMRMRPRMSTMATFTAGPVPESNTSRQGSDLPPMLSGWISSEGLPAAIDGQISSMCAPSTRSCPLTRW